ncbi:hypothetical protein [Oceaniglobus ichthyenteri]|uniref:hypothetical protein n=1 Tax=Oceaniglobus ichthyenteri TaxID=2136177 RepID=UPI000D37E488|nr:hypothetical protein [Oceaniglobus ichthyenteri]
MRIFHFSTVAVFTLAPLAATAQGAPSLWDLLKPEYLVQRVVQTGIMALRTQIDLKYGAMAVDLRVGQVTLSDLTLWPTLDWDADGSCAIEFDRVTIRAAPLNRPDLMRLKAQAQGMNVASDCLPPDQRGMVAMIGLEDVRVPRLTIDMQYDIAQAEADLHAYTQIDGVAAVDITADLSYLWFRGHEDMEDPEPVVYLRHAAVTVENLGGYEAAKPLIPPPFVDPAQAPMVIEGMIGQILAGMNRAAAPTDAPDDTSKLNDAQVAFIDSIKTNLPLFLENPAKLVLETGWPTTDDVFVDFKTYESDPAQAFTDLQPRLTLAAAPARGTVPAALLQQAFDEAPAELDDDDLLRVGVALTSGIGAPRNIGAGAAILQRLAESGDDDAALELSAALEHRDPAASYRWALVAGEGNRIGAAARLDRLEGVLPFDQVLDIQTQVLGDVEHPLEALQSVALMRDEAIGRLSGIGRVRSYSVATLWALMGAAAGDSESRDILKQIDERARMADAAGQAAWAEIEAAAADLAMQAWLGQDLPARFGQN